MKKLLQSFIIGGALLLFLGTGSAQAATATYTFSEHYTATTALPSGNIDANISFTTEKNQGSTDPTVYVADGLRVYYQTNGAGNGGSITLHTANGVKITNVILTTFSTSYTPTVKYNVDAGADAEATLSEATYTISGISAASSLKIRNANDVSEQLRITSIEVTYTAPDCTPSGLAFAEATVSKTTADANFTIVPASDSPAAITYTSSNAAAATVNATSGEVTIVGVGTTTITASQATDGTYCAADATYTLTVGFDPDDLTEFELVTDDSQLIVDGEYIVVAKRAPDVEEYYALGFQTSTNRRGVAVSAPEDGSIFVPIASVAGEDDGLVYKLQLGGEAGAWTLTDIANNTILGPATSGTSNYLREQDATWTISIAGDGTAAISAIATGSMRPVNDLKFNYNSGTPIFACYNGTQQPVYLYATPETLENAATSIGTVVAGNDDVVAYKYYNLQGQEVSAPQAGAFYVVKNIHASGKVSVTKEFKK